MGQRLVTRKSTAEGVIRDIRRKTRKRYGSGEKIRIVLDGLRGEDSIAELCRREGIARTSVTAGRRSSLRRARSVSRATPLGRRARRR